MYVAHLYILRSEWYNVMGYSSVGTCELFGYGRYDYMFSEFDFLSGDVRWMDNYRHEDMLLVLYPNNFILDLGWYEGIEKYVINIIKDSEGRVPVVKYTARTEEKIKLLLQEAISRVEYESNNSKPYYGGLWKTEEKEL